LVNITVSNAHGCESLISWFLSEIILAVVIVIIMIVIYYWNYMRIAI